MYVHPHVCPSVCVIVAASVCMHVLHVCVPACMQSQLITVDDAWVGIICHDVGKRDVRYYCIVNFSSFKCLSGLLLF